FSILSLRPAKDCFASRLTRNYKSLTWSRKHVQLERKSRLQLEYFSGVKYRPPDDPVVRAYADPKVDFIRARISLSGNILDLGCGNGIFRQRLACEGGEVTGLDFSGHLLKQNPHGQLARGDATHLPFMDDAFDVVFEANLLHHVSKVPEVMRE